MPRIKVTAISLCLLSTLASQIALPAWSADGKPATAPTVSSATELANQVAAAYGGMVKIKEMLNRGSRSHGFLKNVSTISTSSNVFECEVISKGDEVRIEMEFLGQPKIEAFDGKIGWTQSGNWVRKADEKTVERISDELKHGLNALAKLDDLTYKLELLTPKGVNGKSCDVLKLTPPDGKWTLLYIDPLTRRVLRSEYMGFDSEQGIEALKSTDYSDYRDVMGMPTPFKVDEFIGGKKSQEAILDGVTIDDTIRNELFEMPEESRYSRLNLGPVTIPFEFVGNEILITARINNGQEAKFVVDTGASQTVIDKTTAQAIGPITTHTFSVTALSKSMPLSYTTLDKVQIGDLNLEGIPALVTDLSTLTASLGQRPAGLIGANILDRFLVTIDFQDKKITLTDPCNVKIPDGAIIVPSSPVFASTGLVVSGLLNNKPINFLVDTGAAFNLLPLSFAQTLNSGTPLAVGQMNGIEGQKTAVGALKLNMLKLGDFTLPNPVFNIRPDKGTAATQGLSSASGMGLLGNPTWSKTKLSIDYRNNRLIIEIPPDRVKLDHFVQQIDEIDRTYLRSKNSDVAASEYEKVMNTAHSEGIKAGEALALARLSALYEDRFVTLKESRWLDMAANEYEKAARLAAESRNKSIEGQILAQWAMLYLNAPRTNTDLVSAQNLLKKALNRAPMDGSIYAALGCAMLKTGKSPLGAKFIDQALMLDPSNWQALNEKFKIFESERRFSDAKLVLIQMNLYYPDFAQVKDLNNRLIKDMKTAAASSTPTNRGVKPTAPAGKANGSSPAKGAPDRAKSNTPPPANTAPSVSAPPPSVTPPSVIPTK